MLLKEEVKITSRKEGFHYRRALLFPNLLSIGPLAVGFGPLLFLFIPVSLVFVLSLSFRILVVLVYFLVLPYARTVYTYANELFMLDILAKVFV